MNVLSLDPGGIAGWARRANGQLVFGSMVLSGSTRRGDSFDMLRMHLNELVFFKTGSGDKTLIDMLVCERPHLRGFGPTMIVVGMSAVAEMVAAHYHIDFRTVATGTLKKFGAGHGRAEKQDMIAAAARRIAEREPDLKDVIMNEHEADALWLLWYGEVNFNTGR